MLSGGGVGDGGRRWPLRKAVEKSEQTKKWIEPHLDTVKTKWIPSLREQILTYKTSADPYIQSITAGTLEAFETSKSVVIPYIIQEAKRVSKPYVDQIAATAKPPVEKARVVLTPYQNKVVQHFRTYWKSVAVYHHQVVEKRLPQPCVGRQSHPLTSLRCGVMDSKLDPSLSLMNV